MVEGTRLFDGLPILETRGELSGDMTGLTCDSRQVQPRHVFVALRGQSFDGHDFLDEVASRGAGAVVVEELRESCPVPQVRVADTLAILPELAARYYNHPARSLHLIGVTGSNGKTTSTYLLEQLWQHAGESIGLVGTIEYRYGAFRQEAGNTTPLPHDMQAILRSMIDEGCRRVAMEVSSHGLVLHRVDGLEFDVALFTNLTQDHLDFHGTMEAYRDAKGLLFSRYLKPDGVAVLNMDDEAGRLYASANPEKQQVHFGIEQPAEVSAEIQSLGLDGCTMQIRLGADHATVHTSLVGLHNVYNILGVLAVGMATGLENDVLFGAVERFQPVQGRLESVPTTNGSQVVVDYSHTPDALEKCLLALQELPHNRILTVFGCGGDRDRGKRPQMGAIAQTCSDYVIVTSDNPRTEDPQTILDDILAGMKPVSDSVIVEPDRDRAIGQAVEQLQEGDILLIAGKGHETYQLVGRTRHPFDDRDVARRHLRRTGKGD